MEDECLDDFLAEVCDEMEADYELEMADTPPNAKKSGRGRTELAKNKTTTIARWIYDAYGDKVPNNATHVYNAVVAAARRAGDDAPSRSPFFKRAQAAKAIVRARGSVTFCSPTPEDVDAAIKVMKNAQGVIRVGSYALTYAPIVDALIWVKQHRPEVEIRVLIDQRWCWSNDAALSEVVRLYENGIAVRHTGSRRYHAKVIAVDYGFVFFGSANLAKIAFTGNLELNARVTGSACIRACILFDKVYEDDLRSRWIAHLDIVAMRQAIHEMTAKRANRYSS